MKVKRHSQPGRFPISPGTCIIKPDFPYGDGTPAERNFHPFIVVSESRDTVTLVMGRTLKGNDKDRTRKLDRIPGAVELDDPCPPMTEKDIIRQYADTSQTMIVPKKVIFESTNVEIMNNGGWKLSREQTQVLQDNVKKHEGQWYATVADPYGYADAPEKYRMNNTKKPRPLPKTPEVPQQQPEGINYV